MTAAKTNERPGTRATLRGYQMSASKARVVLNIIRGEDVTTAMEILSGTTREAADVIAKVLASAVANAVNNDAMNAEELYVSAAFADEGITMKRFSPRARGRAGKIFKRSTHITVIVSRMDEERLEMMRNARSAQAVASRSRRVTSSRRRADQTASVNKREAAHEAAAQAELEVANELAAAEANATEMGVAESENENLVGLAEPAYETTSTGVAESDSPEPAGVADSARTSPTPSGVAESPESADDGVAESHESSAEGDDTGTETNATEAAVIDVEAAAAEKKDEAAGSSADENEETVSDDTTEETN
jgi:large subunit ribosomal protein L22